MSYTSRLFFQYNVTDILLSKNTARDQLQTHAILYTTRTRKKLSTHFISPRKSNPLAGLGRTVNTKRFEVDCRVLTIKGASKRRKLVPAVPPRSTSRNEAH